MTHKYETQIIRKKEIEETIEGIDYKFFITFKKRNYENGHSVICASIGKDSAQQTHLLIKKNVSLQNEVNRLKNELSTR